MLNKKHRNIFIIIKENFFKGKMFPCKYKKLKQTRPERKSSQYVIIKTLSVHNREAVFKVAITQVTHKGKFIRITDPLSVETLKARSGWSNGSYVLRPKDYVG